MNVAEILHVYSSMFPVQGEKVETQVCVFECATPDLSEHDVPHQHIGAYNYTEGVLTKNTADFRICKSNVYSFIK